MTVAPHTGQIVESPSPGPATFVWRSEEDTAAWAQQLAAQPALAHAFVTLHGDLGAGKTTLVRHLLRALGVQGRIKSPTYAVVEPHETAQLAIWHFDFYRFDDPREWEDAGFRDIFASPGLKLAEWPEKAAALTPTADLAITIEAMDETERKVTLHAGTATGRSLVQGLTHGCSQGNSPGWSQGPSA
ncbi:tRNA threonylcarbamoyladenosine biosynthesis protein TsaE [Acidovorax sp. 56]|uniref:tRNA (adenosine(37)-N6)-threonylcarbamoyltransferase complex ATPase subunit type 1 TsaE n=1 Tax=Acidovorax sp. 56 TaxID=2035205 RepID=UPI000C16C128|nr:tRNA (adenosine(37)-N6)-threonylcarbamoyltransferase complex ATPase subunit type 1 TsaE [Acidovorax sp. 56]PIF26995.1 tRNA threonylcarbamoyladenosine biosynthesis protein TsaE [Acidovorax sp. 56]